LAKVHPPPPKKKLIGWKLTIRPKFNWFNIINKAVKHLEKIPSVFEGYLMSMTIPLKMRRDIIPTS
jgi:hypothetical protein